MRNKNESLWTRHIEEYIVKILKIPKRRFKVIPKDLLYNEPPLKDNEFYVLNLDNSYSDLGGTHWVCLCRKNNSLYYYDSFGVPMGQTLEDYIKRFSKNIKVYRNISQNQKIETNLCGYHVLDFIEELYKSK